MRILLVAPDRSVKGGITTVIEGILASDLARKHELLHLSTHRDDLSKLGKLLYALRTYGRFVKTARSFRPELVHIHSSFGASFFRKSVIMLMSRLLGIRQINHIHGAEFDAFYSEAGRVKKAVVRRIYNIPEATIVLSMGWLDKVSAICRRSKVFCLNNFAVLPDTAAREQIDNYGSRENVVLFLGEVGRRKGAYDIPDIAENVSRRVEDVRFIIAGNGEIENVRKLVDIHGCSGRVVFTGWVGPEQKRELLLEARVYLLPSYNEGLPMSILEAMGYGLPIVSTDVGGIPEVVQLGENGFLYEAGDTKGMAEGIADLLLNQRRASEISQNNRRVIEQDYSLEAYAERLDNIYRQTAAMGAA